MPELHHSASPMKFHGQAQYAPCNSSLHYAAAHLLRLISEFLELSHQHHTSWESELLRVSYQCMLFRMTMLRPVFSTELRYRILRSPPVAARLCVRPASPQPLHFFAFLVALKGHNAGRDFPVPGSAGDQEAKAAVWEVPRRHMHHLELFPPVWVSPCNQIRRCSPSTLFDTYYAEIVLPAPPSALPTSPSAVLQDWIRRCPEAQSSTQNRQKQCCCTWLLSLASDCTHRDLQHTSHTN